MAITLRTVKGAALSHAELDANFTTLDAGKQASHANLSALAGLSLSADRLPYANGADTLALATLTAAGRALLDDASAGDQLTTLGVSAFAQTILDDANAAAVRTTIGAKSTGADETANVTAASATAQGKVELATTAETNTGTDTARAVTPDGLAGSYAGTKEIGVEVFGSDEDVAVGDGTSGIPIPPSMNGMNIVSVRAIVHTQGITGTTDIQVRRRRAGTNVDVLSTKVTLGAEYHIGDGTINAANDDLATGDLIFVDVDAVHTTPPKGLSVVIEARLP